MDISVVIRSHNDGSIVRECLEQVFAQKLSGKVEFLLVDEASQDETLRIAEHYPFDRIIRLDRCLSGSHTLNTAFRVSRGERIIQLLGHTVLQDNGTFQRLLDSFSDEDVAAVSGRQLPHSLGDPFKNVDSQSGYDGQGREILFVSNSFVALRKSVWEKFPYDESYMSAEDKPWSLMVRNAGYRLRYEPAAVVFHYHPLGLGKVFQKAFRNAQTHKRIGLSKRSLYFRLDQRVATDVRHLEKKHYILLSPLYRGMQAAGYAAGWYLR